MLVGGFEAAWAAAVWGVDGDTADDWLGTLRRNSLVEAVTLADVKRVAKRLLDGGLLVTVVGRPQLAAAKGG